MRRPKLTPEMLARIRQSIGELGPPAPEPAEAEPVELANDPRNAQRAAPSGPVNVVRVGVPGVRFGVMDDMYRPVDPKMSAYANMKARGVLPEGATPEDALAVASMHIPSKDGYSMDQLQKMELHRRINARDPNYVPALEQRRRKMADRKAKMRRYITRGPGRAVGGVPPVSRDPRAEVRAEKWRRNHRSRLKTGIVPGPNRFGRGY